MTVSEADPPVPPVPYVAVTVVLFPGPRLTTVGLTVTLTIGPNVDDPRVKKSRHSPVFFTVNVAV